LFKDDVIVDPVARQRSSSRQPPDPTAYYYDSHMLSSASSEVFLSMFLILKHRVAVRRAVAELLEAIDPGVLGCLVRSTAVAQLHFADSSIYESRRELI
jgi:hypothetical protein